MDRTAGELARLFEGGERGLIRAAGSAIAEVCAQTFLRRPMVAVEEGKIVVRDPAMARTPIVRVEGDEAHGLGIYITIVDPPVLYDTAASAQTAAVVTAEAIARVYSRIVVGGPEGVAAFRRDG